MVYRIEIGLKNGVSDARGKSTMHKAIQSLGLDITNCSIRDVYKISANM